jgi:hypothetical protein
MHNCWYLQALHLLCLQASSSNLSGSPQWQATEAHVNPVIHSFSQQQQPAGTHLQLAGPVL